MLYACINEAAETIDLGRGEEPVPCRNYRVPRHIREHDDRPLRGDDPARLCSNCSYLMARFPGGMDEEPEVIVGWTPAPPVEQEMGEYTPPPPPPDAIQVAQALNKAIQAAPDLDTVKANLNAALAQLTPAPESP